MAWAKPDKAVVKSMWEGGARASAIAKLFGVTRSAVLGLCDRNGWQSPHTQGERGPSPNRQNSQRTKRTGMRCGGKNYMHEIAVEETEFHAAEIDVLIPLDQRKTLMQLTDKTCHWPVGMPGQPDFFFCGGAAHEKVANARACAHAMTQHRPIKMPD